MRKYRKHIIGLIITVYLIVVLAVVAYYEKGTPIRSYEIKFLDTLNEFITHKDIDTLLNREFNISEASLNKLEIAGLEERIQNLPAIRKAEVYSKLNGHLIVELNTELPVVRIMKEDEPDYYISASGSLIPFSRTYIPRILVANGNIPATYSDSVKLGTNSTEYGTLESIYKLAHFINEHKLWKAQLEQIYVNTNNELELFPRVGAHVIVFGDTTEMQWKFRKLYALYEKGFKIKHWNAYEEIILKYDNQVVCKKR